MHVNERIARYINGWSLPPLCALTWLQIYNERCQPRWTLEELQHKIDDAIHADHGKPRGHLLGLNGGPKRRAPAFGVRAGGSKVRSGSVPQVPGRPRAGGRRSMAHCAFSNRSSQSDAGNLSWGALRNRRAHPDLRRSAFSGQRHRHAGQKKAKREARSVKKPRTASSKALGAAYGFCQIRLIGYGGLIGREKWSRRSEGNLTAWRYLVVESDRNDISEEEWLTFLAQLRLPIAVIVETGRRLAHALIRIDCQEQGGVGPCTGRPRATAD
jgi:hypothetical protein